MFNEYMYMIFAGIAILAYLLIVGIEDRNNAIEEATAQFRNNTWKLMRHIYGYRFFDEIEIEFDEMDSDLIHVTLMNNGIIRDCVDIQYQDVMPV